MFAFKNIVGVMALGLVMIGDAGVTGGYYIFKQNELKCLTAVKEGYPVIGFSCQENKDAQLWFIDEQSRWRPKSDPELAIGMGGLLKQLRDGNKKQQWEYVKNKKWIKNKFSEQCLIPAGGAADCSERISWTRLSAGDRGDDDDGDGGDEGPKIYLYGYGLDESWDAGDDREWYKVYRDCYGAERKKVGSLLVGMKCDDFHKKQRWIFEKKRWRLASTPELCVEAPTSMKVGDKPRLAKCSRGNKLQKWLYSEDRIAGVDEGSPYKRCAEEVPWYRRVGISPKLNPEICLYAPPTRSAPGVKNYVELRNCSCCLGELGEGMGFRRVDIYD